MFPSDQQNGSLPSGEDDLQQFKQMQDRMRSSLSSSSTDAWLQWEYNPEEWAQFDALDWTPTRLKIWLLANISAFSLLITVTGVFFFIFFMSTVLGMSILMFVFGTSLLTGVIIFLSFSFSSLSEARKRHKARQNGPSRITFSKQGVWEAGTHFPLDELFLDLKSVKMTPQPPVLHFRRENHSGEGSPQYVTLHVLVPRGHEAEAVYLMQRYHVEVIEAKKQEQQRLKAPPPEPHRNGGR